MKSKSIFSLLMLCSIAVLEAQTMLPNQAAGNMILTNNIYLNVDNKIFASNQMKSNPMGNANPAAVQQQRSNPSPQKKYPSPNQVQIVVLQNQLPVQENQSDANRNLNDINNIPQQALSNLNVLNWGENVGAPDQFQVLSPVQQNEISASRNSSSSGFSMPKINLHVSMPVMHLKEISFHQLAMPGFYRFCKREKNKLRKCLHHTKKIKVNYELCFSW